MTSRDSHESGSSEVGKVTGPDPGHGSPGNDARNEGADATSSSDNDGTPDPSSSDRSRSERRRRKRLLDQLAESMNLSDAESAKMVHLIDELIPDQARMSLSENIAERLDAAMRDMQKKHPRLMFSRDTRNPIDLSQTDRAFSENAVLSSLPESEEELFRALLVNDRIKFKFERMAMEHEQVRALLLEEFVRRQTLHEQWRHLLPKYMLPIYAMLFKAGVKRNDIQVRSRLFNRIRDAIVDWADGGVDAPTLMAAASATEDEFARLVESAQQAASHPSESFDSCRERLSDMLRQARSDLQHILSISGGDHSGGGALPEEVSEVETGIRHLEMAFDLDGGIDDQGRLVFESIAAFAVRARGTLSSSGSTPNSDEGSELGLAYSEGVYEAGSGHLPDPFESESGGGFGADSPPGLENSVPLSGIDLPPVPVGQEQLVFGPEQVEAWPAAPLDIEKMLPSLPRSTGLCRSTGDDPFRLWTLLPMKQKFCFMGFRRHPDLSSREGIEGPIEPVDLSRLELGPGNWRGFMRRSFSEVLGAGHPLMLPPHSSLAWYGRELGWAEADVQSLSQFGSPAHPDSITVGGDPKKLIDAFRMVALLRIDELVRLAPDHFLAAEGEDGDKRRKVACEDLARWWLFILVARHRQDDFNHIYPGGFFHGVHGPDFVIDDNGQADFGVTGNTSHLILWSMEMRKKIEEAINARTQDTLGVGNPYAGPRRLKL